MEYLTKPIVFTLRVAAVNIITSTEKLPYRITKHQNVLYLILKL